MSRPTTISSDQIVALRQAGRTPRQIAIELGCGASIVFKRLRAAGLTDGLRGPNTYKVDPIWETADEDKRRKAIAKRAAEGARRTLRGLH